MVEEDAEQFALGGLHAGGAAEDCSVELDEKQACIPSVVAANSTARMSDLNIIDPFPVNIMRFCGGRIQSGHREMGFFAEQFWLKAPARQPCNAICLSPASNILRHQETRYSSHPRPWLDGCDRSHKSNLEQESLMLLIILILLLIFGGGGGYYAYGARGGMGIGGIILIILVVLLLTGRI